MVSFTEVAAVDVDLWDEVFSSDLGVVAVVEGPTGRLMMLMWISERLVGALGSNIPFEMNLFRPKLCI